MGEILRKSPVSLCCAPLSESRRPTDGPRSLDAPLPRARPRHPPAGGECCSPESRDYVCLSVFTVTTCIMPLGPSAGVLFVFRFPKGRRQGWTQAFPLQLRPGPRGGGQPDPVSGGPVHSVSFSALGVQPGGQQWPPLTTETASTQAKEGPYHAAERLL